MGSTDAAGLDQVRFGPGDAVLHVRSPGGGNHDGCREVLPNDGEPVDVLRIDYVLDGDTPRRYRSRVASPGRREVVAVGVADDQAVCGADCSVTTVSSPADLIGVGIVTSERLQELSGADRPLWVCFEGLEAAFERTAFDTAFQFCHVLIGQTTAVDAVGYFLLVVEEPSSIVPRIADLFDAVVREHPDGSTEVRPR